jgi:hypothetical protein
MFVVRGALDKSRLRRFVVWVVIVSVVEVAGRDPEQFSGVVRVLDRPLVGRDDVGALTP